MIFIRVVFTVSPVADLCPVNQLVYQTVQSGTAEWPLNSGYKEVTKRDLYTCGVWVESVSPVADLCPANQLMYQTVQYGTAE